MHAQCCGQSGWHIGGLAGQQHNAAVRYAIDIHHSNNQCAQGSGVRTVQCTDQRFGRLQHLRCMSAEDTEGHSTTLTFCS